jgi:hypothetical protein
MVLREREKKTDERRNKGRKGEKEIDRERKKERKKSDILFWS